MVFKIEEDLTCEELEIFVRYAKLNQRIERLIRLIRSVDAQIRCCDEGSERLIDASDIFYIESVDKRTFVYLEQSVYRTDYRLYQLAQDLESSGFVQINKSCILNINALDSIKPLINSRMEATLKNGERIYITRKYLEHIKQALKGGRS